MIKNIFFDLDNTIIKYEEDFPIYYKEALKKCNYDENDYLKIYNAIDLYEESLSNEKPYYNKIEMIDFINKELNSNYSYELVEELNNVIGKYWIKTNFLTEETLQNLYKKYNIYLYTNYFTDPQAKRIENIGYLKYFKKIFGADLYGSKPYKSSFEKILKEINAKPEECVMIGDNKSKDIMAANNIGMKSILFDYDGKRDKKEVNASNYIVVNDINEIINIL
jgi:putative hydrolase of the HAD superfamily